MYTYIHACTSICPSIHQSSIHPSIHPYTYMVFLQYARTGDVRGLERLLADREVQSTVNQLDDNGLSALHYAARFNQFQAAKLLLEKGRACECYIAGSCIQPLSFLGKLHYLMRRSTIFGATFPRKKVRIYPFICKPPPRLTITTVSGHTIGGGGYC